MNDPTNRPRPRRKGQIDKIRAALDLIHRAENRDGLLPTLFRNVASARTMPHRVCINDKQGNFAGFEVFLPELNTTVLIGVHDREIQIQNQDQLLARIPDEVFPRFAREMEGAARVIGSPERIAYALMRVRAYDLAFAGDNDPLRRAAEVLEIAQEYAYLHGVEDKMEYFSAFQPAPEFSDAVLIADPRAFHGPSFAGIRHFEVPKRRESDDDVQFLLDMLTPLEKSEYAEGWVGDTLI